MARSKYLDVGAREREVLDVVLRRPGATALDIQSMLTDAPSTSALRTMLIRLEAKGLVHRELVDGRNSYRALHQPAQRFETVRRIVRSFFGGSAVEAIATLLDDDSFQMSASELDELEARIATRRRAGHR